MLGENVPTAGSAVHACELTSADMATSSIGSPPGTTVWSSSVWMLTVGSVPETVIVTIAVSVSLLLSVTVKVSMTGWFAVVVAGAVQVGSSTAGSG